MSILIVFLYALVVVLSLLLIGIVLIQPAKSGGMGAAFGGIGESVWGGKAGSHLTKATVIMTSLFFILTLILAALIGRGHWKNDGSGAKISRSLSEKAPVSTPAAPASPAQK
jgi:preprotein translocase subunit SecG